eukprot:363445-Prorocentrum_minimum.AAC.3
MTLQDPTPDATRSDFRMKTIYQRQSGPHGFRCTLEDAGMRGVHRAGPRPALDKGDAAKRRRHAHLARREHHAPGAHLAFVLERRTVVRGRIYDHTVGIAVLCDHRFRCGVDGIQPLAPQGAGAHARFHRRVGSLRHRVREQTLNPCA